MSDLDQYGPDRPCRRDVCADKPDHLGGAHTDPRSDLYDGPEWTLKALPLSCRDAAQALFHHAHKEGWDKRIVETALGVLAREVLDQKRHVAAAWVDRDRGVNAAIKRAEDCEAHGADLRFESHQAWSFSVEADRNNEQRLAWLGACHDIEHVLANARTGMVDPEVSAWVAKRIKSAGQSQDRIAKKYEKNAPTHADCQRAGKCEHPSPTPHEACEALRQPTLFDAFEEEAAA